MRNWSWTRFLFLCCSLVATAGAQSAELKSAPSREEQIVALVTVSEGVRAFKEVCEERFPRFKSQNEAAYLKSPYSQPFIEQVTSPEVAPVLREKARKRFPNYFEDVRQKHLDAHPAVLERDCSEFPQLLDRININVQRLIRP